MEIRKTITKRITCCCKVGEDLRRVSNKALTESVTGCELKRHMSNLCRSSIAVWCVCGAILIAMSRAGLLDAQSVAAPSTDTLLELRSVDDLKTFFNKDVGKFRLALLLSPTCLVCVAGSRWIQEKILARYPDAKLRVYAISFNMFPGDARSNTEVTKRLDQANFPGRARSKLSKPSPTLSHP